MSRRFVAFAQGSLKTESLHLTYRERGDVTDEDFHQLQRVGLHLIGLRVGLLSPSAKRRRRPPWRPHPRSERTVFPSATALSRQQWDLNVPGREEFELLVASSVLMYAAEPARWLGHILATCEHFLMIDLVRRRRAADSEFGVDGDCMRYAIGAARPRVSVFFDLDTLGDRVVAGRTYFGGANAYDAEPLHLIALVRGDLVPSAPRRVVDAAIDALAN